MNVAHIHPTHMYYYKDKIVSSAMHCVKRVTINVVYSEKINIAYKT